MADLQISSVVVHANAAPLMLFASEMKWLQTGEQT